MSYKMSGENPHKERREESPGNTPIKPIPGKAK